MENESLLGENEEMLGGKDAMNLVAIMFFFLSGTYVTHVTWRLSEERLWN